MKVVWVTPALPHPLAAGGWAHEFELIRALAERHQIEVVSSDLAGPLDEQALLDAGVGFTRVPWIPEAYPDGRFAVGRGLLRADPNLVLWSRRDRLPKVQAALREVTERWRPDLVHITLGELAPLVRDISCPTAILLFDSLTREIESRLAHETMLRRRVRLRLEARRTRQFERDWYRQATALASVSSVDAKWFEEVVGRPVEVIENPIAEEFFDPPSSAPIEDLITFVGTLNHHPNVDAIEWLVREVWPLVQVRRPAARLRVVGRGDRSGEATQRMRALVEGGGGELHADVDDIRPYYWESAVVVAPMRLGAGMRNKVIHAMACGVPVVATPTALEGVPDDAIAQSWVAPDAVGLANALEEVLSAPAEAAATAATARRAVESLRTPDVAQRLDSWWARAAGC